MKKKKNEQNFVHLKFQLKWLCNSPFNPRSSYIFVSTSVDVPNAPYNFLLSLSVLDTNMDNKVENALKCFSRIADIQRNFCQ